jgi:hypothetical protein
LRVCRDIYAESQPIFLKNALFECVPLRLSHVRPSTGQKVKGGIAEVVRPCDEDGSWYLDVGSWLEGVEGELKLMFDSDAHNRYIVEERGPEWAPWLRNDSDEETLAEGESYSVIDLRELREQEGHFYSDLNDDDWDVHGARNATEMITYCRFLQGMRFLGPEKCTLIRHLRIIWGEEDECGESSCESGPTAIALVALLASIWLPALTEIRLIELKRILNGEDLSDCICPFGADNDEWSDIDDSFYPQSRKLDFMGIDEKGVRQPNDWGDFYWAQESRLVQTLDMLDTACPKVSASTTYTDRY